MTATMPYGVSVLVQRSDNRVAVVAQRPTPLTFGKLKGRRRPPDIVEQIQKRIKQPPTIACLIILFLFLAFLSPIYGMVSDILERIGWIGITSQSPKCFRVVVGQEPKYSA